MMIEKEGLSKAKLKSLPVLDFEEFEANVQTGDLIFCSGNYLFSNIVKDLTQCPFSHVAFILKMPQFKQILVMESVETHGVRLVPLHKYFTWHDRRPMFFGKLKPYKGEILWARPTLYNDLDEVEDLFNFGMNLLTKPYDFFEIVKILWRIKMSKPRPQDRDGEFICSEFVQICLEHINKEVPPNPNGFVSPKEIFDLPNVQAMGRIH